MKTSHLRAIAVGVLIVVPAGFIGSRVAAQTETYTPLVYCVTNVPIILSNPEAQVVLVGATNVTFKVVAEPQRPLLSYRFTYQWQQNIAPGMSNYVDIQGATNDSYTIGHAVSTNDVAYYRVIVAGNGTATSEPAPLLVAWTNQSFSVSGTPVVSGGSGGTCPGAYAGYVVYYKPKPDFGWAPTGSTHTATDPQRTDTKVEAAGLYQDLLCDTHILTFPASPTSPKYRFTIYFPSSVPTGGYNITLSGFVGP